MKKLSRHKTLSGEGCQQGYEQKKSPAFYTEDLPVEA